MGGIACEVSNHSSLIVAKRTALNHIINVFEFSEVHFKFNKNILEFLTSDYVSKQVKRNPSNEQAFLRFCSGLLELGACLETTDPKLSLIVEEIHAMETIIEYTTDSFTNLFTDHANRLANLLQEVTSKNRQSLQTMKNLMKEFHVIIDS